jgi:hypothetical protein
VSFVTGANPCNATIDEAVVWSVVSAAAAAELVLVTISAATSSRATISCWSILRCPQWSLPGTLANLGDAGCARGQYGAGVETMGGGINFRDPCIPFVISHTKKSGGYEHGLLPAARGGRGACRSVPARAQGGTAELATLAALTSSTTGPIVVATLTFSMVNRTHGGGCVSTETGVFQPEKFESSRPPSVSDPARAPVHAAELWPGPARGRRSALRVLHGKSNFDGGFVWARRALNSLKRRFPAYADKLVRTRCVLTVMACMPATSLVRSRPGRLSARSVSIGTHLSMAVLYGHAGC